MFKTTFDNLPLAAQIHLLQSLNELLESRGQGDPWRLHTYDDIIKHMIDILEKNNVDIPERS